MGDMPQEVVEDEASKTRRRALLCTGIMVILLLGNILGSTPWDERYEFKYNISSSNDGNNHILCSLGDSFDLRPSPRPSMKPSQTPTSGPLKNRLCEEATPIILGGMVPLLFLWNKLSNKTLSFANP